MYCIAFNRRLRALPVTHTNPLGLNGWLARLPIAKMPTQVLEEEVLRILESAMGGWLEVVEDSRKTADLRVKWAEHRVRVRTKPLCYYLNLYAGRQPQNRGPQSQVGRALGACSRVERVEAKHVYTN